MAGHPVTPLVPRHVRVPPKYLVLTGFNHNDSLILAVASEMESLEVKPVPGSLVNLFHFEFFFAKPGLELLQVLLGDQRTLL